MRQKRAWQHRAIGFTWDRRWSSDDARTSFVGRWKRGDWHLRRSKTSRYLPIDSTVACGVRIRSVAGTGSLPEAVGPGAAVLGAPPWVGPIIKPDP